jgi:hypothetical protein
MTELELLNLARSTTETQVAYFTQIITINFAMVVAIYYFLHRARLAMKIFAFIVYSIGMILFLGQMVVESNVRAAAMDGLRALPAASLSRPGAIYLGVYDSWLSVLNSVTFNIAFWVLGIGVAALLFFWKREPSPAEQAIQ